MTINGEGQNPTWNDCLRLASVHNISVNRDLEIKENVQEGVSNWQCLARDLGVSSGRIHELETSMVHLLNFCSPQPQPRSAIKIALVGA